MSHTDLDLSPLTPDPFAHPDPGQAFDGAGSAAPFAAAWDTADPFGSPAAVFGTPEQDTQFWQPQTTAFTCAVMAQCGIIGAFTGEPVSEAQLVYEATANGWLSDGGMSPLDVGNLLQLHGIDCHVQHGAAIDDLMAELAQGHKVIVGLDSGEIWGQDSPLEDFFQQSADHAIWVTGVDLSDPGHPRVIVNDSGDPDGAGKAYDLDLFVDAWKDSGFFYVATDQAPPDLGLAASQFDHAAGVFPALADFFGGRFPDFRDRLGDSAGTGSDPVAGLTDLAAAPGASPFDALDQTAREHLFKQI